MQTLFEFIIQILSTFKKKFSRIVYFRKLRHLFLRVELLQSTKITYNWLTEARLSCPNSQQNFPVIVTVLRGTKFRFSCGQEPSNPISRSIGNHVERECWSSIYLCRIAYTIRPDQGKGTDRRFDDMWNRMLFRRSFPDTSQNSRRSENLNPT